VCNLLIGSKRIWGLNAIRSHRPNEWLLRAFSLIERRIEPMTKSLNPVVEGLGTEARETMTAVFDALSEWRGEVGASTERYNKIVLDKMATAARAVGWPNELIEVSRTHLMQVSKMQMQLIDQLMDTWQQQLKSPMPGEFMAQLRPYRAESGTTSGIAGMATTPVELWMQAAGTWQRNLTSAWSMLAGQAVTSERPSRAH
jgi:hypothetical protein